MTEKKCINCEFCGESFTSSYDGRWLVKCDNSENKTKGANRPHHRCELFEPFQKCALKGCGAKAVVDMKHNNSIVRICINHYNQIKQRKVGEE